MQGAEDIGVKSVEILNVLSEECVKSSFLPDDVSDPAAERSFGGSVLSAGYKDAGFNQEDLRRMLRIDNHLTNA